MKSLIWITLLLGLLRNSAAELSMIQHDGTSYCIASGDPADPDVWSALTWTQPLDTSDTPITGWRHPTIAPDSELTRLNCDQRACDAWTARNKIKVSNLDVERFLDLGLVLDHRWEKFPLYLTNGLNVYNPLISLPSKFEGQNSQALHFSILAVDNARFLLAKGKDLNVSPFYEISIQVVGIIVQISMWGCPPQQQCAEVKSTRLNEPAFSWKQSSWVHFTIKVNYFPQSTTIQLLDENNRVLLERTDTQTFHVNYVSCRTQDTVGYWKLHQYNILQPRLDTRGNAVSSTAITVRQSQTLCLSITYYSNGRSGTPTIGVWNGRNWETNYLAHSIKWQTSKLHFQLTEDSTRVSISWDKRQTFYIGDIRVCSDDEVYVSVLKNGTECTQMKSKHKIRATEVNQQQAAYGDCLGRTFGPSCRLTCGMILGKADDKASCWNVAACNHQTCSCLSGFKINKRHNVCGQTCDPGKYGANCQKDCEHCWVDRLGRKAECDDQTGECDKIRGCQDGWTGKSCDIKIVVYSPVLSGETENSLQVTIKADVNTARVSQFIVFYKEASVTDWISLPLKRLLPMSPIVSLTGLKSDTSYLVKVELLDREGQRVVGLNFKAAEARTKCTPVALSEIQLQPLKTAVTIIVPQDTQGRCTSDYWIQVNGRQREKLGTLSRNIENFQPNTFYTVTFYINDRIIGNKNVTTLQEAPSKVENLEVKINSGQVSAKVSWTPPYQPNGVITKYILEYQHAGWKACGKNSGVDSKSIGLIEVKPKHGTRNVPTEAFISFSNLVPFSTYHVTVRAFTVEEGEEETMTFDTPPVPPMTPPLNVTVTEDEEGEVSLQWRSPSCEQIGCRVSAFRVRTDQRDDVITEQLFFTIKNLEAYKEYNFEVSAICKGIETTENSVRPATLQYKTKPKPPPMVQDLTSPSQGPDWVMVQWRPPSPPRGQLETYLVTVENVTVENVTVENVTVENVTVHVATSDTCSGEKQLICHTIQELKPNSTYFIQVSAKNKDVSLPGNKTGISVTTTVEGSEAHASVAVVAPAVVIPLLLLVVIIAVNWWRCKRSKRGDIQRIHESINDANGELDQRDLLPLSDFVLAVPSLPTLPSPSLPVQLARSSSMHSHGSGRTPVVDRVKQVRRAVPLPAEEPAPESEESTSTSRPVRLQVLEIYVETAIKSGELRAQHAMFPRGQTQPWDYGRLPENKSKNRYGNLVAYDATRVKLEPLSGVPFSDYINANYLDGYKNTKGYIATQGPRSNTLVDFWRMVWQENVHLIVMLANVVENGKPKCDKYWPDVNSRVTYGDVTIQNTAQEIYADFTYRNLELRCQQKLRKVLQMHFTSWPDHGVPMYPQTVAAFLKKILATRVTGPMLVHCSAGVGRTGCIILADACLRMAAVEGEVNVLALLANMRAQRPNMVDNYEQYQLVHLVLVECLLAETFNIPCTQFPEQLRNLKAKARSSLKAEFSRITKMCKVDAARRNANKDTDDHPWPENKSRFPKIVPGTQGRVLLSGSSDYINAVYVDGFRTKSQFIATQLPLPDTVGDFWLMVEQTGAGLVLVLNQPDPGRDQTTCTFWPDTEDSEMFVSNSASLVMKNSSRSRLFVYDKLELRTECVVQGRLEGSQYGVQVISVRDWPVGEPLPSDPSVMVELWREAERLYEGKGPIIVVCHDGATGCGLLLAVSFVVEKMKLEHEVDVALAVRTIRNARGHFVTSLDQYEHIYNAALNFLDTFDTYSNFN